ncbi:hypothetical protein L9F63_011197 [Diploptera punctata]|uniref:Ionotropic glutamate receptor C-terminal domain-containing protein n=1 Tax=Diploptera punctata TaxID=6984 RepID=A0AAD8EP39_DIPPU|nr:hypothetical protein L9F63_011197 [Diploptera punctata]
MYIPCPGRYISHGNFYKVFTPGVRLLFFLTCILMAVITISIRKINKSEHVYFNSITYSLSCIWAVVTSVSVPQMPRTTMFRMFFIMWVCYCLIFSTVFQSFIISFLIEPGSEKDISSVEELLREGSTIFGEEEILQVTFFISENLHGTRSEMKDNSVESTIPIEEFFRNEHSALLASDLDMKIKFPRHLTGVKSCSFYFSDYSRYSVQFNPFCPYYEALNKKVMQFFEGGLLIKEVDYIWNTFQSFKNTTIIETKFRKETAEDYFVLNMKHMKLVFIIYLCSNLISAILFLEELHMESLENKISDYKSRWIQHVHRMEDHRIPKLMLRYQPAGRRRPGRPLKRLLDGVSLEAETGQQMA